MSKRCVTRLQQSVSRRASKNPSLSFQDAHGVTHSSFLSSHRWGNSSLRGHAEGKGTRKALIPQSSDDGQCTHPILPTMLSVTSAVFSMATPTSKQFNIPVVPNRSPPGQTSGLSWVTPGEGAIFDPLNLLKTPEDFERLRYTEIKHGRVAMLAVLGHVTVAYGGRWGGEASGGVKFTDIQGSGYAALSQFSPVDYAIIFLSIGFLEQRVMKVSPGAPKPYMPGDLRNGLFNEGWDGFSEREKKEQISKELNNGRAAMMGIFALMTHEAINGARMRFIRS